MPTAAPFTPCCRRFLCVPYLEPLGERLLQLGWRLAQMHKRSSYLGYGICTLQTDTEDMDSLVRFLAARGARRIVLMGHSTGCQNIVHHARHGALAARVSAAVLQAPVSDREYLATLPDTDGHVEHARALLAAGRPDELMPRDADTAPITARRYLSLAAPGGDDDMFSTDIDGALRGIGGVRVDFRRVPCRRRPAWLTACSTTH